MNNNGLTKAMAFMLLLSCSATGFALAAMAYMLTTGEIPFQEHLGYGRPIFYDQYFGQKKKIVNKNDKGPGTVARVDEEFLLKFYQNLETDKKSLAEEREKLKDEKKSAEEILTQAQKMQKDIAEYEIKVKNLLQMIDKKAESNLIDMAKLISGMEMAPAGKMLMELDKNMAAKVLYYMNRKVASELISETLKTANKEQVKKITEITDMMRKVSEDINAQNEGGTQ
jgi:hypothetical protein